ncbi:beta-alanine-activating enzyme [Procambarus clarkii]|uniref:beta-alanine-activating enzyme n=1 Tax=Procambarus clarkii TaxID=6728 RepID=UPI001E670737|nr:beta-alanine-activating enzyme-like [Procambarus clarkii]XP_045607603.1 beta-alanine-activating enzyme-like [Procambarus clarkii]XP_045607604.1 beta-alanine-activating enzyme-like [Procambarus clarkii]XP_045607605.1 beta-alanine-activating enzyme-like [Procambarus clarkii]
MASPRNLYALFQSKAAECPQNLAVIYFEDECQEKKVTYSELQTEAVKVARILSESTRDNEDKDLFIRAGLSKEQPYEKHKHVVLKQNTQTKSVHDKHSFSSENKNEFNDEISVGNLYSLNGRQSYVSEDLGSNNNYEQKTVIGILCSQGPGAVACILGIVSQNAYIYISPEYTKQELASILGRVCPKRILVEEKYLENIAEIPFVVKDCFCLFETCFKIISLDSENQSISQRNGMNDLAYVIPTSGSTGVPKYVFVPHRCIVPNIIDLASLFGVEQDDCIFCAAPLTFDPSVVDMFMAFTAGAVLVMVSPHLLKMPRILLNIMVKNKVSILQATPTLLLSFGKDRLRNSLFAKYSPLKVLALGGEIFPKLSFLKQIVNEKCRIRIFNLYGITEVSCWATVAEIVLNRSESVTSTEQGQQIIVAGNDTKTNYVAGEFNMLEYSFSDMVPIGDSLSFTTVKLLNKSGGEVKEGEEGEIFIGGHERECWVDDGTEVLKQESRDINNTYIQAVFRKTGDRGILSKGHIYCIGRLDRQVKRNGQKISLAEICKQCRSLDYVDNCHVELLSGNKITTFVYSDRKTLVAEDVWQDLKRKISYWKLPDNIIIVKNVPFNKHGKVDTLQLLSTEYHSSALNCSNYNTSLESYFEDLWKKILGCYNVGPNDNFIKSGGTSLNAVYFTEELKDFLGCEVPKLLDVLLNETFSKTLQVTKKYQHSIENLKNVESLYTQNPKKLKSEHKQAYSSQSMYIKPATINYEDYSKPKNSFSKSHYKGKSEKSNNSKNEHESLLSDPTLTILSRRGVHSRGMLLPNYYAVPYKIELLWKYNLSKCIDSSPVVTEYNNGNIFVFVGSHSHKFACINAMTGMARWCLLLGDRVESSPIVSRDGRHVYVGCYDSYLYCICIENGQILWKYKTGGEVKSSPVIDDELNLVIFGSHDKKLYCLTADGELKWSTKLSHGSVFSSPCVTCNYVLAATLDGVVCGVDKNTGNIKWSISAKKPVFSSLASYSRGVIFANVCGEIFSYSLLGSRLWIFKTEGNVFSSPFVLTLENGAEVIGIGCHDHSVYFLNSYGDKIAQYKGSSPIYATPFLFSLCDHKTFRAVICETSGRLFIVHVVFQIEVDTENPNTSVISPNAVIEVVLETILNGELFASPIFFRNKLYVGSRDDFLYCFNLHS